MSEIECCDGIDAIDSLVSFEETLLSEENWHYQGHILRADVGELQEKWQFPSDHLPIGMTVNNLYIASWNVMNTLYFRWVEMNSQGLRDSMLKDENYIVAGNLTRREQHTIEMVLEMIEHPTSPRSLLSLQECGHPFLEELKRCLPERMVVVLSSDISCEDQNVVIYDSSVLQFDEAASKIDTPFVNSDPRRNVMNLVFHRGEEIYRVINVHVPGDPNLPGVNDLAAYVERECREGEIALCMGDLNFNETEVKAAFDQSISGYSLISPYPTNVGLDFFSKCVDHFFIKGTDNIEVNGVESLLSELPATLDLLVQSREPSLQLTKV